MRCGVDDVAALEKLLGLFFAYERLEIAEFRKAVEQFKVDLPAVLESLRNMIARAYTENAAFRKASQKFLAHAQEAINPSLSDADVREMLIQHVLTEEIFSKVFGEDDFHQHNNVAKELYALEARFPGVTLVAAWPGPALARIGLDEHTAVVILTHDPKLDDPALCAALQSPVFYVGALGSARTHAKRIERLREHGLAQLAPRIHAPVGLDLGGRAAAEIAVSVLAQVIQERYRRAP